MKIILNSSLDPYFNLAAEEYLMDTSDGDVFMLWRNSPSVIIGKNQNAYAEVNTPFTEANGIPVVRRLTGGGAVFHDPGNVNFTFITDAPDGADIDFAPFIRPILAALGEMGISASADGRNDIVAEGYKISGNAQCVRRRSDGSRRLMHHGTLLYDADLTSLAEALSVNEEKLRSKGIRSVSSRVKNIREIGNIPMDSVGFLRRLLDLAEKSYGVPAAELSAEERKDIAALAEAKYSTWEWNFGRSPECTDSRTARFPWGTVTAGYTLARGIITECSVTGDYFGSEDTAVLESALAGCRFDRAAVAEALAEVPVGKIIAGATADDIADLLFGCID